jgi:hypothetical protein
MKTLSAPEASPVRKFSAATRVLAIILVIEALVSCGTNSNEKAAPPVAFNASHWHRVNNDPPTYFPKGVPANHGTEFSDGYWVSTGDKKGSRYFIPARRADTMALIAEAQAAMTPEKAAQLERDDHDADLNDVAGNVVKGGILTVLGLAEAVAHTQQHAQHDH